MSIQFSGLASGLPVDDIIRQLMNIERRPLDLLKQRKEQISTEQSQYQAVSSRMTSLRSALTELTDARLGLSFDLFEAKTSSSSDSSKISATVQNTASQGSFTVDVINLATATKAQSAQAIGIYTSGASNVNQISEGSVTSGSFTVFVNNQARSIAVDPSVDTVQNVIDRIATEINTVTGQPASASVTADGKIELNYTAGTDIRFGATGDTSNFAKITFLATGSANPGLDTFTAQYGTSTIDRDGTLVGNAVGLQNNTIAAGTFTIGSATFTIDASTTLSGLMGQINTSSEAGVFVSFNAVTNKIEMVSKETGNQAITLDDNGTGFLESVELVNGVDTLSSQTLGNNAKFKVNGGSELQSTSNEVDSATSGLTGITLNLIAETGATPITIDVKRDTDKLKSALEDFISKFNTVISFIDEQTKKDGKLHKENALKSLRNTLRMEISDNINFNTTYTTLAQVGISSGAVNTNPSAGSATASFSLDASKLLAAIADDSNEVRNLMVGDGVNKGIFNILEETVEGSLDTEFGIFSSRQDSANDQIKSINNAIERGEDRLELRERQLRAQFAAMERMIAQLQKQQTALNSFSAK